jgi:5-methyltetrahydropteroyltriglutamate--homocysteine methyltransferase
MALHADHVGSLLRPPELLEARGAHLAGRIDDDELRAVEDASILEAIRLQQDVGLEVFTDGEYRRSWFAGGLPSAVEGLVDNAEPMVVPWEGRDATTATSVTETMEVGTKHAARRLSKTRRSTAGEIPFLRERSPGPFKVTLTSAIHPATEWYLEGATPDYPNRQALIDDLVAMLQEEVRALVDDGVPYIQLDSLLYVTEFAEHLRESPDDDIRARIAEIDREVLAPARDAGVTTAIHMCRGNNRSSWNPMGLDYELASGVFERLEVDRLLLEYDTERAGGFEPLSRVPDRTTVVLGLISSKFGELEPREELLRRIEEASRYVPIERLAISPQCGFASTAPGNLVSWDDQRRKLELVVRVAEEVWGRSDGD